MVSDVIREIRENPEVREEVRRLIMTDELLAVPAILARMEDRQGRMEDRQGRMEGRLDRIDERQGRMDERQDQMEETQRQIVQLLVLHGERLARVEETQTRLVETQAGMVAILERMEADLAGIKGSVVESRAQRRVVELASAGLGLHSSEVVVGPMLPTGASQQFLDACQQAEASAEQRERLRNTDLIIRARKGTDGASKPVYLTVEVAYRLDDEDINRVSESMAILRGLIPKSAEPDAEVMGAIYGTRISDRLRGVAETRHLNVFDEELPR